MTRTPPPRPQRPSNSPSYTRGGMGDEVAPKPYELIPFPKKRPTLDAPAGHHQYLPDRLHGTLFLTLTVKTALHVSTGVVVMGSDIGNNRIPLIKTMVQDNDQKLSIQGSSLKGCIRSVYEAITNSTLAVVTSKYRSQIPTERLPCRKKEELCPASRVFGALDWQGLVDFNDATCQSTGFTTGFMPSLYRPRPDQRRAYFAQGKIAGRKFYYHTIRAIDKKQNQGIPVQQAAKEYTFATELHFMNLQAAELGTLLVTLGQDPKYPIALKVGGGKPIGMGTMTVAVNAIDRVEGIQDLRDRYSVYTPPASDHLIGEALQQFMQQQIQAAHAELIEAPQLNALLEVLRYPTDREPPAGMY
ncbi:RAMP superfamily CRISPR-associated protein [Leptolyngbya sp. 7M]|uniref:RAMP superfamily CRISPR-associated protein n=1 Tax=Leptolyngbya sp. 7M TaxID=2812896 RepID=UPI001B8C93B8|nr:RAMP superfamily CRISPR-associated protein [Leptolyngbya sp. 7M]QYO68154.1 CRISPR-associated protein [Leptolyngbya sp. 7M]